MIALTGLDRGTAHKLIWQEIRPVLESGNADQVTTCSLLLRALEASTLLDGSEPSSY